MSSAIILGDPHIGGYTNIGKIGIGGNLNSKIIDQINLLDWTLDQAIESHSNNIIITGDIFDEPKPHPSLITIFIAWLKKCQAYDVNVHIIMGNHDLLRSGGLQISSLDIIAEIDLNNVSVYKDINTIYIGTTAFTLIPFRDRKYFGTSSSEEALKILKESLIYELSSIPVTYKKVIVGHLAITGSIPVGDEIDDLTNELFCDENMFQGYDYVWMGHVHKPQTLRKNNPYMAHIGSMDISNFGETDHKKIIIIFNCLEGENKRWNEIVLPTRSLKKISVVVPSDVKDSTQYVLDELKKNKIIDQSIIKLEVSLSSPELKSVNKSVIEQYFLNNGAQNVANITETKKISLIKKKDSDIDNKMDINSAIKKYAEMYIDSKSKSDFIEMAMDTYLTFKNESKE